MSTLRVATVKDLADVAFGMNKYILGTVLSNTVTTSATEFTSWTNSFGNPSCPQFNYTTGNYTAPETGWYKFDIAMSMGAANVRVVIGLKKNGVDAVEALDLTPTQYVNAGASYVFYLTAGDTIRPWVSYAAGATNAQVYFSGMMVGK